MTRQPDISVVIPVYNGMPHLPQAIESVLSQEIANLEVVVVENQSTDGTGEWLAQLQNPAVRIVSQPAHVSAADNWQTATEQATGAYIKLMCADDTLLPGSLARQKQALDEHPNAAMTSSQRQIINHAGVIVVAAHGLAGLKGEVSRVEVIVACAKKGTNVIGEPSSVLMRAEVLKKELPWSDRWPYVIDLEMFARVLTHGSLVVIREPMATFRLGGGSWSSQLAKKQASQFTGWIQSLAANDPSAGLTTARLRQAVVMTMLQQRVRRLVTIYAGWRSRSE